MRDIHDIMTELRSHPDYVWGTVFTFEDVEDVREQLDDCEPACSMSEARDRRDEISRAVESACMGGGDWTEAIRDIICVPGSPS